MNELNCGHPRNRFGISTVFRGMKTIEATSIEEASQA
jgi:hypothetical protein